MAYPVVGIAVTASAGLTSTVLALDSTLTPDWANLSVGVAAIVGLVYVVRTMRGVFRDNINADERREASQREADVTRDGILRDVAVNLGIVSEQVRTLHHDNVKQAATLKASDEAITRKVEEQS